MKREQKEIKNIEILPVKFTRKEIFLDHNTQSNLNYMFKALICFNKNSPSYAPYFF